MVRQQTHLVAMDAGIPRLLTASFDNKVKPLILKDNAMRLLKLGPHAAA